MALELKVLTGDELAQSLPDVAGLRIKVFREWPYLYEGDHAYEERYLEPYLNTAGAVLVGAFDGAALVRGPQMMTHCPLISVHLPRL